MFRGSATYSHPGGRRIGSRTRTAHIPRWIGSLSHLDTTLAKLLSRKQELIARLQQENIGPDDDEIERLLDKIEGGLG